jgi:hypothetical protein
VCCTEIMTVEPVVKLKGFGCDICQNSQYNKEVEFGNVKWADMTENLI